MNNFEALAMLVVNPNEDTSIDIVRPHGNDFQIASQGANGVVTITTLTRAEWHLALLRAIFATK